MNHSFDVEIAKKYGVNVATFLENIAFWINHNIANKQHFYNDMVWTYNTQDAFTLLFPYWSRQNIRTIVNKCLSENLIIITSKHNKKKYDKTTWFALTEKGLSLFPHVHENYKSLGWNQPKDWLESTKGLVGINQPIPDINTDVITDNKNHSSSDDDGDTNRQSFNQFWSVYPRKIGKESAWRAWKSSKAIKHETEIFDDIVWRQNNEWRNKEKHYIPHPSTYLNGRRWNDERSNAILEKDHGSKSRQQADTLDYTLAELVRKDEQPKNSADFSANDTTTYDCQAVREIPWNIR